VTHALVREPLPHDDVRAVANLLQVFNLLGWQKSPDLLQGPFALDRILEMSLRRDFLRRLAETCLEFSWDIGTPYGLNLGCELEGQTD
jgi:hypothetical protein